MIKVSSNESIEIFLIDVLQTIANELIYLGIKKLGLALLNLKIEHFIFGSIN